MEALDRLKWFLLAALVSLTALVYFVSDTVVRSLGVLHPSTKLVVVQKRVEHRDVQIHRTTVYAGGVTTTTETLSDKTKLASDSTTDSSSTPTIPKGGAVTLWLGGGINLDREYHGSVGASLGPLMLTATNTVWPMRLDPKITASVGIKF